MKKFIAALMISAMLMITPGCALIENEQVQQLSSLTIGAPILIADIQNVSKELTELHEEKYIFSDSELDKFDDALITFDMIKMEYEAMSTLDLIPDMGSVKVMWEAARSSFLDAMKIVDAHRGEYSAKTIISIDVMEAHAIKADSDMTALLNNPSVVNIGSALKILEGLVKIGLKVAAVV